MTQQPQDNSATAEDTVSPEFKELQRKLNQANARAKRAEDAQLLGIASTNAGLRRLETLTSKVLTERGDEDAVKEYETQRQQDETGIAYAQQVNDLLRELGKDWQDEDLAAVRQKRESGDQAGAIADLQAMRGMAMSNQDVEAEVERRVTERLRSNAQGVDSDTSTQAGNKRLTWGDVDTALYNPGADFETLKKSADAALDQLYKR